MIVQNSLATLMDGYRATISSSILILALGIQVAMGFYKFTGVRIDFSVTQTVMRFGY